MCQRCSTSRDLGRTEPVELSGKVPMTPRSANTDLLGLKCLELHAFLLNCCSFAKEYSLASGIWLSWGCDLNASWSLRSQADWQQPALHQDTLGTEQRSSESRGYALEGRFLAFGAVSSFRAVGFTGSRYSASHVWVYSLAKPCTVPEQGTKHVSVPTVRDLHCMYFFRFHQDRHLYKE